MSLNTTKQLHKDLLDYFASSYSNEGAGSSILEKLESILTPAELSDLPNRLSIIKQLKAGVSQHKIAQNLGVGVATVTRGAAALKMGQFTNVEPYSKDQLDRLWPNRA
jgi:TrpR family trp operon transcriptional repressor